jgi:DNA-binding CsgD family transcriptional regulator
VPGLRRSPFVRRPPAPEGLPTALGELSKRELEVLRHVAGGQSNAEIAAELYLSDATVKTHVAHILQKSMNCGGLPITAAVTLPLGRSAAGRAACRGQQQGEHRLGGRAAHRQPAALGVGQRARE